MEVVLLWLDDLDDLLFALSLLWERGRSAALQVGLAAALCLAGLDIWAADSPLAPLSGGVAVASVAAWVVGTALAARHDRGSRTTAA